MTSSQHTGIISASKMQNAKFIGRLSILPQSRYVGKLGPGIVSLASSTNMYFLIFCLAKMVYRLPVSKTTVFTQTMLALTGWRQMLESEVMLTVKKGVFAHNPFIKKKKINQKKWSEINSVHGEVKWPYKSSSNSYNSSNYRVANPKSFKDNGNFSLALKAFFLTWVPFPLDFLYIWYLWMKKSIPVIILVF